MFFSLLSGALRFFAPRADEFSESTGKLTQSARSFLYRAKGGIASRLSAGCGWRHRNFIRQGVYCES